MSRQGERKTSDDATSVVILPRKIHCFAQSNGKVPVVFVICQAVNLSSDTDVYVKAHMLGLNTIVNTMRENS